jgi:hypothetical protein
MHECGTAEGNEPIGSSNFEKVHTGFSFSGSDIGTYIDLVKREHARNGREEPKSCVIYVQTTEGNPRLALVCV